MIVKLDAKRRLTIPASLAEISPGDAFEVSFDSDEDALVFRRVTVHADRLAILKERPVPMDEIPSRITFASVAASLSRKGKRTVPQTVDEMDQAIKQMAQKRFNRDR